MTIFSGHFREFQDSKFKTQRQTHRTERTQEVMLLRKLLWTPLLAQLFIQVQDKNQTWILPLEGLIA